MGHRLLILVVLSLYAMVMCRKMPRETFEWSELTTALREGVFAIVMPVILLGGIYSGYFTATEAAAVALVYACFVEMFIHHELKPRDFYNVVLEQSKLGGSLFPGCTTTLAS